MSAAGGRCDEPYDLYTSRGRIGGYRYSFVPLAWLSPAGIRGGRDRLGRPGNQRVAGSSPPTPTASRRDAHRKCAVPGGNAPTAPGLAGNAHVVGTARRR